MPGPEFCLLGAGGGGVDTVRVVEGVKKRMWVKS